LKTCLVTGGAGFIGSHIADQLIQMGHQVIIIDDLSTGLVENINPAAEFVVGNVSNHAELEIAFSRGIDVVFHIAGRASTIMSFADPTNDLRVNVLGTINVLNLCLKYRVPRLLYASSMTVYGPPSTMPIVETEPCQPISYYGIGKYAAERYAHATALRNDLESDFHVTSFRMFNVYGERQSLSNPYQGVMAIFIGNILRGEPITIHSDGQQTRDFISVKDVVNAWMAAWDKESTYGEVFNLGTGSKKSINELVDLTLASLGYNRSNYPVRYAPVRPGDQRHMQADVSKAKRLLDWSPKVPFEDGMRRILQWAVRSNQLSHVGQGTQSGND
jgi:UDP-glucose 4-epimerase